MILTQPVLNEVSDSDKVLNISCLLPELSKQILISSLQLGGVLCLTEIKNLT